MVTVAGVFLAAVLGPLLLSYLNGRQQRASKQQDYDRLDAVADRAEKNATAQAERAVAAASRVEVVADQAKEAATLLLAANERVAEATHETAGKLDAIHALVNSQLSAALQSELNGAHRELAVLRELVALRTSLGETAAAETVAAIEATSARARDLEANLADRAVQTAAASAAISAG